jgi:PAS domain-containing protein
VQRDITERKRAEEEIIRLAEFPSENPNPVLRVAKDGTILYANKGSLPLLNLWGSQVGQLLPDDWRKFTSDALTSGSRKEAEAEHDDHILSLTFAPVVDAEYVNVYGLDITERKRAEEEIRHRSEELAALYDVSLDLTAQLDLDTLLKTILLRAQGLLRANAGGLYLYDPERQDLELIVGHGLSKDYTGTRLALGQRGRAER